MALSEKLYALRKQSGLSQEQLAQQLNVSRQAISKWESGTATPETEKLLVISAYFQVSLDYLLKEECDAMPSPTADIPLEQKIPSPSFPGLVFFLGGILCLILWGLISVFSPKVSGLLSQSSMIQLDGNGIFLILCAGAILTGAALLLKGPK